MASFFHKANLSDPCYNYTVLDHPWRAINNTDPSVIMCDRSVTWSGWYRLFINNMSAQIPDICVARSSCGTTVPLWIRGGHPTVQDGVVNRDVCGHFDNYCCHIGSFPIKVKACPGNYYVYELVRPTLCNLAYCADVSSFNSSSTAVTPATISTAYPSVDPCYNYTVLDDPWRANSSQPSNSYKCDQSVTWSGWYRLFINNLSAQIPDTCVEIYSCGTNIPLWIHGEHPAVTDGVVTRDICGHWSNYCCYYGSYPIKVKACPGNYYVYELVRPTKCSAYCAAVTNISSTHTTVTPETSPAGNVNITAQELPVNTSLECLQNILELIELITAQELPVNTVMRILKVVLSAVEKILESSSSSASPTELASYGNRVLKASEKLISILVKPTDTNDSVSFTLAAVEVEVFMVGPNVTLDKIPQLETTTSSVDIDLIGIAKNNNETKCLQNILELIENITAQELPVNTVMRILKVVLSAVEKILESSSSSASPTELASYGNRVLKASEKLISILVKPTDTNDSTSSTHLLNLVCVIVGLVFFTLALLTFALCRWSPGVNNVARINICISLLLAHLLFLLTQQFLSFIWPQQVLCAVISGLLHFLFLSGFVWMFIEAVLLFICVKNLSQISSKKREVLSSGFLFVIGYVVALVVVCVSVGLVPDGYGSEHCWIKMDKGFIWSFLGPVCIILALNMILFICIIISLNSSLTKLNADVSQLKKNKIMVFKTLAQCVVLGCSWILGFFTNGSKVLEILFLILNSQQGTFIFLIYCVLNNEVREQYRKFFRCLCCAKHH
ncbi:adhesion G protein-coupled receptor E1-like [Sinocyclocheilus anshuiensis]|uniref:adhesion G protein-coupled receptor E1-like n=1 Tax=Sinocyclocheilus anshuiensis TaxID=1608454 RepID=UPI0007B85C35|nr:PREDICTED: adhesion G protein-coupled receptor E1-like [Sinocyclocheilus anshuiensis]